MAKIVNPILFSNYFGVDPAEIDKAELIDPFLNVDLELFIDPVLLEKSKHSEISGKAIDAFRDHFSKIVRLLKISSDLPLNFHPAATGARLVFTPIGAG